MRPTFLINLDLQLVSALASKSQPHALQVGHCLELTADFITPWGNIPAGTKGFVDFVDDIDGLVELLVEGFVPALHLWGQRLVLVPFATDDLLECLVCCLRSVAPIKASATVAQLRPC